MDGAAVLAANPGDHRGELGGVQVIVPITPAGLTVNSRTFQRADPNRNCREPRRGCPLMDGIIWQPLQG